MIMTDLSSEIVRFPQENVTVPEGLNSGLCSLCAMCGEIGLLIQEIYKWN